MVARKVSERRADRRIGGNPSGNNQRRSPRRARDRPAGPVDQAVGDGRLKAGGDVLDLKDGGIASPQHGAFQPGK